LIIANTEYRSYFLNKKIKPTAQNIPTIRLVDFRKSPPYQPLPYYLDLDVGDVIKIIKKDETQLTIRIESIEVDSRSPHCPRTRIVLSVDGHAYHAFCGMKAPKKGGVKPLELNGVNFGIEITRLLFSEIGKGKSPFNAFTNFKLQGDLRVTIWDPSRGLMPGTIGCFVVKQPTWSRDQFGNWLHATRYGIHSAIDIFATTHGVPEKIICPVNGKVDKVYNRNVNSNDNGKSKVINIYGDAVVGPSGEKILYRFHHLSRIYVADGEKVKRGQTIGMTGHTGFKPSIGDHLHFEMRLNPSHFGYPSNDDVFSSIPVNPYFFLLEWYGKGDRKGIERD
jgi:murein DD-endopeptidase MepM/ murein hydrolase activator NlpD